MSFVCMKSTVNQWRIGRWHHGILLMTTQVLFMVSSWIKLMVIKYIDLVKRLTLISTSGSELPLRYEVIPRRRRLPHRLRITYQVLFSINISSLWWLHLLKLDKWNAAHILWFSLCYHLKCSRWLYRRRCRWLIFAYAWLDTWIALMYVCLVHIRIIETLLFISNIHVPILSRRIVIKRLTHIVMALLIYAYKIQHIFMITCYAPEVI